MNNAPQMHANTPAEALQIAEALHTAVAGTVIPHQVGQAWYATAPAGYSQKNITDDVEKAQIAPNRKRGTVKLKDLDSLLAYCADQVASERAYIYADPDTRVISAIFNDQRDPHSAGWRDHRAEFHAEFTPEFDRWMGRNGHVKAMSQAEFAEFIEDNLADITEPAAQQLLEVASTIQAKTDIQFSSAKRLDNGQVQLGYTETIDARAGANGALEIPREFALGLRIFKNGGGYKLIARLTLLHSYEVPAIVVWPIERLPAAFGDWVEQSVR